MSFIELPIDLYCDLIKYLSLNDIQKLSCVNRYLSLLNRHDYIWKTRTLGDKPSDISYYQYVKDKIYQRDLSKLKNMILKTQSVTPDYISGLFFMSRLNIVLKIGEKGPLQAIGVREGNTTRSLKQVEKDALSESFIEVI